MMSIIIIILRVYKVPGPIQRKIGQSGTDHFASKNLPVLLSF